MIRQRHNRLLGGVEEAFFLEGAYSLSAKLHLDFFAVNHDGLSLEVGLPDFFGVALRETDIIAVLLAFTGEITLLHRC